MPQAVVNGGPVDDTAMEVDVPTADDATEGLSSTSLCVPISVYPSFCVPISGYPSLCLPVYQS